MEHFMNLFATAALALTFGFWNVRSPWPWFSVGVAVAAASLVKQVAVLPLIPLAVGLLVRDRPLRAKIADLACLSLGFASTWAVAFGILALQGAWRQGYDDVFRYGRMLASETPADPLQYSFFVRWVVGNTDPKGILPWPFGKTDGRAWWAAGLWPLWLVSIPVTIWAGLQKETWRRLTAVWILTAWVEVALPGLFWQHYEMLVLPGMAIAIGVALADSLAGWRIPRATTKLVSGLVAGLLFSATLGSVVIQVRDYLLVTPDLITTRYKGGRQWVVLRQLGTDLGKRSRKLESPHLFVWGIHSPLLFYSHLDGVTPQLFTDPLLLAHSQGLLTRNPRVEALLTPRKERTIADLIAKRPALIFLGAQPFPELQSLVKTDYRPVPDYLPGLYLRRDLDW